MKPFALGFCAAGTLILMGTRIRIELGRITEIETLYFPGAAQQHRRDGHAQARSDVVQTIPNAQHATRAELISVADAYFSGLEKNDGKRVNGTGTYPFAPDCNRIENGSQTANVPRPANMAPEAFYPNGMDCLSQMKLGYYFVVQEIHGRRYPVVDTERGIVWAHGVIDQGTVNKDTLIAVAGRPNR